MTPTTSLKRLAAGVSIMALLVSPLITTAGEVAPVVQVPRKAFMPVPAFSPEPTPVPVIVDTLGRPERSRQPVVVPTPRLVVVASPTPFVRAAGGSHSVSGKASWYCLSSWPSICTKGYPESGPYAAAGPALREAICGDRDSKCYKGKWVSVNGLRVRLIDYCQCHWNTSIEKVIDLYHGVWSDLGSPKTVTIRW